MKTRPSKSKILLWKLIPITHSLYSTTKKPKRVSSNTKVIEGHEPPTASSLEALIRVLSNGVLFRMLSDKVLFRILRDIVLFRVVADRDHRVLSNGVFYRILSGTVLFSVSLFCFVLFYIFSKRRSHLAISLTSIINLNKTDSEKYKEIPVWLKH